MRKRHGRQSWSRHTGFPRTAEWDCHHHHHCHRHYQHHDDNHHHDNDDRNLNHAVAGAIEALTMARTVSLARHCLSETLS